MKKITVTEFAEMSPPVLRLAEAHYLFAQFKSARNTENHGLFLLTVYFDALLFCSVSIEEMVDAATRDKLRSIPVFLFFKALRNIATHHSVLSGFNGKFTRPIARVVYAGVNCNVEFAEEFFLLPDRLKTIFDAVLQARPSERHTIDPARSYLAGLESTGNKIMIVDLIQSVISEVESHVS
ncbi:MAG: hypothetical protein QE495_04060 [Acidovorax sp.]|uniref:hypothetical protein n=1 Tax=Acidovorax sp. TaxID=1872122 RepID=UPI0026238879|nr:hypothetical protein [Acidovorax sp.]MDH4425601.1 hypothetical protein [Acidovorax sp.]